MATNYGWDMTNTEAAITCLMTFIFVTTIPFLCVYKRIPVIIFVNNTNVNIKVL
jgi:hypothetical protein